MKLVSGQDNSVPTLYVESAVYHHLNAVWLLYSERCLYYFIVPDNPFCPASEIQQ